MGLFTCTTMRQCACLDFFFFIHSAINVFALVLTVIFTQQGYRCSQRGKNQRGKSASSRAASVCHCVSVRDCVLL